MLFDDAVDAVLAVLEMVLAIVYCRFVWLPSEYGSTVGCGTRGLGGATGEEFKGRRDVPSGRGSPVWCVRALAPRRAAEAEALASALRRVRVLSGGLGGACAPCAAATRSAPAAGAHALGSW